MQVCGTLPLDAIHRDAIQHVRGTRFKLDPIAKFLNFSNAYDPSCETSLRSFSLSLSLSLSLSVYTSLFCFICFTIHPAFSLPRSVFHSVISLSVLNIFFRPSLSLSPLSSIISYPLFNFCFFFITYFYIYIKLYVYIYKNLTLKQFHSETNQIKRGREEISRLCFLIKLMSS